jgi:DNA polymerase I-like protein with 3'-5' exonuclease and polymerase domains
MSLELVFDIETNGLLDTVDQVHCIGLAVVGAKAGQLYANQSGFYDNEFASYDCLEDALENMKRAERLIGHNIIGYDLPVLEKVLGWTPSKNTEIVDTLVMSRLIHTNLKELDSKSKKLEPKLWGSHSLKAWGIRHGSLKGDYGETTDWAEFSDEMAVYCQQDVNITMDLYYHFLDQEYSKDSIDMELAFARIMSRQEQHGFNFDVKKGQELYVNLLKDKEKLAEKLRTSFGSWFVSEGEFTPKKDNKKRGYTSGASFTKIKTVEFNPNSRDHISSRLQKLYGWLPNSFTPSGKPEVNESILSKLRFPNCQELKKHFLISKRVSQLAEGDNAWLKLEREGRLHGRVNTNGAVTGRCTHFYPNIAQVPASYSPYGKECRTLFTVGKGKKLVGVDADGLELRALAGYMSRYDKGKYVKAAVSGDKKKSTDIHSINMKALDIANRDTAKTWFYAFIYGAGDMKLGLILGKGSRSGRASRQRFLKNVTGLQTLTTKVKETYRRRGYLIGLDGRRLHIRSEHSALNTLLQSAGAVLMKKALVILDEKLKFRGLKAGQDYEFVANIHDEFQIEVSEKYAKDVAEEAERAIRTAGEFFEFGCPLSATAKVGKTWAETH